MKETHVAHYLVFGPSDPEPEHLTLVLDLDVPETGKTTMDQWEVWEREQAGLVMSVLGKLPQGVRFRILGYLMEQFATHYVGKG